MHLVHVERPQKKCHTSRAQQPVQRKVWVLHSSWQSAAFYVKGPLLFDLNTLTGQNVKVNVLCYDTVQVSCFTQISGPPTSGWILPPPELLDICVPITLTL